MYVFVYLFVRVCFNSCTIKHVRMILEVTIHVKNTFTYLCHDYHTNSLLFHHVNNLIVKR